MDYQENEMRKLVNKLPKVKAPDDFEDKLYARIQNNDFYEEKGSNKVWVALASSAAGLAIAFYSFGLFSGAPTEQKFNLNESQIVETNVETQQEDSVKQAPKPFDKNVIIVNDKK